MLHTHLHVPAAVTKREKQTKPGTLKQNHFSFGSREPLDRKYFLLVFKSLPKLRLLVAVLIPRGPRFDRELILSEACVGKSGSGTGFSPTASVLVCQSQTASAPCSSASTC